MKKLVNVQEVEGEGLIKFLGEQVIIYCDSFFYSGVVSGVNGEFVLLTDASIVYDVGEPSAKVYTNVKKLPYDPYIMKAKIEHFGKGK